MGKTGGVRPPLPETPELSCSLCRAKGLIPLLTSHSPLPHLQFLRFLLSCLTQPITFPKTVSLSFSLHLTLSLTSPLPLFTLSHTSRGSGCGRSVRLGAVTGRILPLCPQSPRVIILPKQPVQPRGRGSTASTPWLCHSVTSSLQTVEIF